MQDIAEQNGHHRQITGEVLSCSRDSGARVQHIAQCFVCRMHSRLEKLENGLALRLYELDIHALRAPDTSLRPSHREFVDAAGANVSEQKRSKMIHLTSRTNREQEFVQVYCDQDKEAVIRWFFQSLEQGI